MPGDLRFFLFRVAGQPQQLHPIQQRLRNTIERVGRGDEEHLRQVERQVEIVVVKLEILSRVENFEQRRGRITPKIAAELVDLVEHQQRILHAGAANRLDDAAGHGADVRAAMAAQLGLVVQAAQAHALEFASQRAGDRFSERRLADTRRADKAQDRRLGVGV